MQNALFTPFSCDVAFSGLELAASESLQLVPPWAKFALRPQKFSLIKLSTSKWRQSGGGGRGGAE